MNIGAPFPGEPRTWKSLKVECIMSLNRFSPWWMALAILAALVGRGQADEPGLHTPFIDPREFDPDFQWFAPPELGGYGSCPKPNTGFYFTYDRTHFNVTRPESAPRPFDGDATWGNRISMGFMTEDDHGWMCELFAVRGPNLREDPGDPTSDPVNVAKTSGVELDKSWRLDPLHNGSIIEPFIGVRFMQFTDFTDETNTIENNILGGQIGFRCYKKTGAWVLSNETRFCAAQNWVFTAPDDFAEFVPIGDIRFEAAYELSREVAIRVGWQMLYMGDGVWRPTTGAAAPGAGPQDVLQTGLTFGFTVNR